MAEVHVCIMENEFKHIAEDMTDRKNNERDMQKNISDIRTSQEKTMFVTEQVQKTQEAMVATNEKNQAALAITTKEYQIETTRINKENSDMQAAGFKAIEDRRIADEKAVLLEKKEAEKEKVRLKELQDVKDEAVRLEKKADRRVKVAQTWSLFLIGLGILGNLVLGVLVKWAPTLIGLPAGK